MMVVMSSACSDNFEYIDDNSLISLRAVVNEEVADTRASSLAKPFRGTVATEKNPLEAIVLFSTDENEYKHDPVEPTYLPCHSKVTFTDDSYEYPERYNGFNLKYPIDNSKVYCVGLSPADDDWNISDDGKYAEHPIDGNDDIMFAACKEGTWSERFEPHHFKHQLTWLKLCVYATDSDAYAFWGNIESITVKSRKNTIVSLVDGTVAFDTDTADICAFEGSYQLKTTLFEIGSIFCSPETEYMITVKSQKGKERTISIRPKNSMGDYLTNYEEAIGNLYVVELGFTPFAIIEGDCVLNPWEYQEENIYLK